MLGRRLGPADCVLVKDRCRGAHRLPVVGVSPVPSSDPAGGRAGGGFDVWVGRAFALSLYTDRRNVGSLWKMNSEKVAF